MTEGPEGEVVMVYDDPTDKVPLSRMFSGTIYLLAGDKAVVTSQNRLANLAVNEPLDEALFELGETSE